MEKKVFVENRRDLKTSLGLRTSQIYNKTITAEPSDKLQLYIDNTIVITQIYLFVTNRKKEFLGRGVLRNKPVAFSTLISWHYVSRFLVVHQNYSQKRA